MNRISMMKSLAVAVVLVAGLSGAARADDSSMNPFTGESHAYFNGGDLPRGGNPVFDKAPSVWRQSNPNGVSERRLQSYSGVGEAWHLNKPAFSNVASDPTFRQTHPNGLTEREYQAVSSWGPAWHSSPRSATTVLGSKTDGATVTAAAK